MLECCEAKAGCDRALSVCRRRIVFADDMLVKNAVAKIDDGDVILTYGYSSTVFAIFMQAQRVRSLSLALIYNISYAR